MDGKCEDEGMNNKIYGIVFQKINESHFILTGWFSSYNHRLFSILFAFLGTFRHNKKPR